MVLWGICHRDRSELAAHDSGKRHSGVISISPGDRCSAPPSVYKSARMMYRWNSAVTCAVASVGPKQACSSSDVRCSQVGRVIGFQVAPGLAAVFESAGKRRGCQRFRNYEV